MFPPHWSLSNTPPEVSLLLGPVRPLVVRAVGRRLGRLVGGHVGRHAAARAGAGHALTNQSLVLELCGPITAQYYLGLAQHPHVVAGAPERDVGRRHLHEAAGHQGRGLAHPGPRLFF